MGTKNNPAPNDCYAKAEGDEPLFTLLARDPLAADLVRVWAKLRAGAFIEAAVIFQSLMVTAQRRPQIFQSQDAVKASEALTCALSMEVWRNDPLRNTRVSDPVNYEMEREERPYLIEQYREFAIPDDDWFVPDWAAKGYPEMAGPFATIEEAEAARQAGCAKAKERLNAW